MLGTILLKTHVLQRLPHLHSRQSYLSTKPRHDIRGGEIYRLLVLPGLAIAGGDKLPGEIRRLIRAVAGVEPCNLISLKPIPESRVEKMTNLGIYPGIIDCRGPRIVDIIHLEHQPSAVTRLVGQKLHVISRGTEGSHVGKPHLTAPVGGTILHKRLRRHRLELVHLLAPHTVNLLHVDKHVLGEREGIVLGHSLRISLHTKILTKLRRQQVVHKGRLIRALRTEQHEDLMIHHIVVERCRHHRHQPSAHIEVEVLGRTVAAVHHPQQVGDIVVTVPFGQ